MGCQCANQKDEDIDDLIPKNSYEEANEDELQKDQDNNNFDQKEGIFGLTNREEEFQDNNNYLNQDRNAKYADYPEKMLNLINKIREDPVSYADIIEDSIKNIIEEPNDNEIRKIYKRKVKVALTRGEEAFREAAELLRCMPSLPPLEFKNEICVPLPENEEEIKDSSYLKEQVKIIRENANIDVFYKDLVKIPEVSALLMIVDDSGKNPGRKRDAVLSKDFKYIGITSKFIGKVFIAYFTFSS
jgi:hypothetical protein